MLKFCVEGKASGMTMWGIFHWASAITMPELVEINLVTDNDDSVKMKFVITLLRFFSLRNEIVKVI